MKYRFVITSFLLILGIFSSMPHNTFAEIRVTNEDIGVQMIPSNPEPYSDVTIRLSSFATDLNKASIDWKVSNKTILNGIGRTSYSFKTGAPNTTTTISVTIVPIEGISITRQIIVRPSEIEILWQAVDAYTPAFYKGKALPVQESQIKVVAFPNTINVAKANKKTMVYNWSINNDSVPNASGYSKDSFTFTNNILLDTEHIGLSVATLDNAYSATGTMDVNIVDPKLLFYKKSPINGTLYDEALVGNTTMTEDEMTLVAEPYFFNRDSNDLQYTWKINGDPIETPNKRTELTIRPSSRGGYATINLAIESVTKLFQSISSNIRINL